MVKKNLDKLMTGNKGVKDRYDSSKEESKYPFAQSIQKEYTIEPDEEDISDLDIRSANNRGENLNQEQSESNTSFHEDILLEIKKKQKEELKMDDLAEAFSHEGEYQRSEGAKVSK